jgi:ABC-type ATPase with predicted acetyltransferase domain
MSVIVATSHDDLIDALQPEIIVSCDFGVTRVARVEPASMLAG